MELEKNERETAVASLKRYADRNLPEPMGDLAAGLLLDFFLKEIGPLIYNQAIHDAQARLGKHIGELDSELFEQPFLYWPALAKRIR